VAVPKHGRTRPALVNGAVRSSSPKKDGKSAALIPALSHTKDSIVTVKSATHQRRINDLRDTLA
jgi:hypothetical protein